MLQRCWDTLTSAVKVLFRTWYILGWGGVARPLIPWPFSGQFLIACLRHLTRNHTLCKTIINIDTPSYLSHWQSQNYLQLNQLSREELLTLSTQYTSSSAFIILHFLQRWTRFLRSIVRRTYAELFFVQEKIPCLIYTWGWRGTSFIRA